MGKKRSRDSSGAGLDTSQKKQKHSAASSDKSLRYQNASSHMGHNPAHDCQKRGDTRSFASKSFHGADREAPDIPQQASNSTRTQAQDPQLAEKLSHSEHSNANGDYGDPGKALKFPVSLPSPSSASIHHHSFSKPAKACFKGPAHTGRLSTLPPLPHILDTALESVAFTHPGTLSCDVASKVNTSYDRLEFLGDAYIELMATRLLFSRFPGLSAGRLSQRREMLVKNETLAGYAIAYGFDQKAKLPKAFNGPGKDNRKIWLKTLGDIFEAFVAAVIVSDPERGFQVAEAWLTVLWEPKLSTPKPEDMETVDPKAKMHLAQKVMGRDIKIDYRDEARPVEIRQEGKLIFQLGVYLTGWGWEDQHLGSGKGLNKQEAGQRAAADALANPLTAQVASVKKDFDAQLASERRISDQAEKVNESVVGNHE